MTKTYTLQQVLKRSDEQFNSDAPQRRSDLIAARLAPYEPAMRQLAEAAGQSSDPVYKIHAMRAIAEKLAKAAKGKTPCDSGCSHCCHIPVMIPQIEAEVIAAEIGQALAPVTHHTSADLHYVGTPCPFLKKGKCSIYASRPFVCRTHYSVASDPIPCITFPGESIRVRYYHPQFFLKVQARVMGVNALLQSADLREFFPEKK